MVESQSKEESPDKHGSTFTVALPLGKDHLPAAHIIQDEGDLPHQRFYARGIIDEATHWASRQPDERTPSESSDSGGSSEGSKMDPSTLFFVKSDVILLGASPPFSYPYALANMSLKWMIMLICAGYIYDLSLNSL